MGLKVKPTRAELRGTLLMILGIAITIMFISGGASLWRGQYSRGSLLLALGGGLAFAFFREWKLDLVIIGLVFLMVNVGLTTIFHPSALGTLITLGSAIGIALLGRRLAERRRGQQGLRVKRDT